jgi:hypothetical protein
MPTRAEQLFAQLQDATGILDLIGKPEDAHFDCKEWATKEEDAQKVLAKAACGLSNADGGVIVFGMRAESKPKDEPDVVESAAPVSDTSVVASRVLTLLSSLVEPGITGVQIAEVPYGAGKKSGFVSVYIPKGDGAPKRSRKDWKFYLRIGSATLPMEYWQIEERFGRRPHPKLTLHFEELGISGATWAPQFPIRKFLLGLRNDGAGGAKFPSVQFRTFAGLAPAMSEGLDGVGGFGIPMKPTRDGWQAFRGGMDDIIYPGEMRPITKLIQSGERVGPAPTAPSGMYASAPAPYRFKGATFSYEISCDGTATIQSNLEISEFEIPKWPIP